MKLPNKFVFPALAVLLAATPVSAENFGHFVGRLILSDDQIEECFAEDEDGFFSIFRLIEEFRFIDRNQDEWAVPSGACVNGASIPPAFWGIIGGPWSGKYRRASVIHDHFTRTRERRWEDTHRVFYDGMLASDVPERQAKMMYFAVRRFGARWENSSTRSLPRCTKGALPNCEEWSDASTRVIIPDVPEAGLAELLSGIDFDALSLDEIDGIADAQLDAALSK